MGRLLQLMGSAFALLFIPSAYAAETISADHVKVSWVAPAHFSGLEQTIGIRFEIDPHWHIYWKNPGDSGSAPKFKFNVDSNAAEIGAIQWPQPKRFLISDLTNIGYEESVVFPITIKPKVSEGTLTVSADLEWLVCQEECLPGFGQLTLTRPIKAGEEAPWENQNLLQASLSTVPRDGKDSPWSFESLEREGDTVKVTLKNRDGAALNALEVFPVDLEALTPARPLLAEDGKAFVFKMQSGKETPKTLAFVLADGTANWEYPAVPFQKAHENTAMTFIILLLSAFVGGIILNLMPCVLPVLSIKFFSLAKVSPHTRFREAMLYTLGVLITFTALGALFLGLRAGGAAIGWGFQLQSPPIVIALIILFWLMGLSFLGFFEFGNSLTRAAGKFENTGSFATGCLSVFIATPCTGPFMGTALGAATVLPALEALTIFFFLGLGLASPFLALAFFPQIKLPKPGMWMITLRQFLAFPLFATVIWLLWILGAQLGTDAWLYSAALGLILTFCIWLGKGRNSWFKGAGLATALAALIVTGKWVIAAPLASQTKTATKDSLVTWESFDAKAIRDAQAKGQAVFVDFTAAWCVTCQVNKKAVLETPAADAIFAANKVKLIRADWTNLDENITTALAEFERASVPLYLFYPADGSKPLILPQILTLSDVEGLFKK